jgi:hypothetical protein
MEWRASLCVCVVADCLANRESICVLFLVSSIFRCVAVVG